MNKIKEKNKFLFPGIFFLIIVFAIPLVYAIMITFFKWNLLRPDLGITFVGLKNYFKVFNNIYTWKALGRTLYFVLGAVGIELILGTGIALLLNRDFPGSGILSSLILSPFMLAPIVVGFTWRFLFNGMFGPLTYLFSSLGLDFLADPPIFANSELVMPALITIDVWQFTPFVVLVVLAGLKALPYELFEAADVDGASTISKFRYITLPMIKPSLLVAAVIRTLTAIRIFDTVMITTRGGPGYSSEVLSFLAYRVGFESYRMGEAGTIGILTLFLALIFTLFYIKVIGVE
ncbi:MAG: carbohydrate ABC transporter permease [Halanaerobiaceae bacterium]